MAIDFIRYNADQFTRLGLLKVLIAVLPPQRRSEASEVITRKYSKLLFNTTMKGPSQAEVLIREASSSWNLGINSRNSERILEWGRLYGLVGAGNQITEKGMILRQLMGPEAISSIASGDFSINPFILAQQEKFYFLYIQFESDAPFFFLLKRIGSMEKGTLIRGMEANRLTCLALYDTYKVLSSESTKSSNLLVRRRLVDLLARMVSELKLQSEIPIRLGRTPQAPLPIGLKPMQRQKKSTKASDHEAIPRFEFLCDLGLLTKTWVDDENGSKEKLLKQWRYYTTESLHTLSINLPERVEADFCSNGFAQSAVHSIPPEMPRETVQLSDVEVARLSYDAYQVVKRPFGHTPIESVAIVAMIRSLLNRKVVEVADVHRLFLSFKTKDLFPKSIHFAAGNDLNRMFIDIEPTFPKEVDDYYGAS